MSEFFNQKLLTGIVISLLLLSILCQIMIGVVYQNMIKETDNMAATENRLLKQCKLKFTNCYQLNAGVTNIPIFVEKFINRLRIGGISLTAVSHLSGQLMLLSVFVAGVGVCKGIIEDNTIGSLLPYYIVSFFGLYIYFSVSSLVDANGKRKILQTNIIDYLENNMLGHLRYVPEREAAHNPAQPEQTVPKSKETAKKAFFSKNEEEELEELLKEFLT